MTIIVILAAATACLCLLQACHIIRRGDAKMFFLPKSPSSSLQQLALRDRIFGAVIYGIPAVAILALFSFAVYTNGATTIFKGLSADPGNLAGGLTLFIGGLLTLLWPEWILRRLRASHPEASAALESGSVVVLTRVLGALLLSSGIVILGLIR